ncbi:MAG: EamA family transporter RarD [Phenylobacterium sp.]
MTSSAAQGGDSRLALGAGIGCYLIWGIVPLVFQAMGRLGVSSWEILAARTVWAVPVALLFVFLARQGAEARAVLRNGRTMAWLTLSALLVAGNWSVYIWAVNSGRVLEASLGYYIIPLIAMGAGALLFHERIDRLGATSIALAALGVGLQAVATGGLPFVSLALALSFGGYGIVRKRVAASAQTGFLVECLLLAGPGLAYWLWLHAHGAGHFLAGPPATSWLIACGPITAVPLVLFAWAARRIPLSALGFLQFISPSISFVIGVTQGEPFTPLRATAFVFIWGGAAVFAYGAWRRARSVRMALAVEAAPAE